MQLLFGSSDDPFLCTFASGLDYSYKAWQENGVWHEVLHVFGEPVHAEGVGFRPVMETPCLVSLFNEETHLWKCLELRERGSFASSVAGLSVFVACLVLAASVSQILSYVVGATGWFHMAWYFRYPFFFIAAIALVIAGALARDELRLRIKLWNLQRFVKKLPNVTGKSEGYYREILKKMIYAHDKQRAFGAKVFLQHS